MNSLCTLDTFCITIETDTNIKEKMNIFQNFDTIELISNDNSLFVFD